MKRIIMVILLLTGCGYARLDYDEAMKYREIVVSDLETIVAESYGMRTDGWLREKNERQQLYEDCWANCMELKACTTDLSCMLADDTCSMQCGEYIERPLGVTDEDSFPTLGKEQIDEE